MYAIVEISGDQYKITPDNKIKVPRLKASIGDIVEFNKIFTIADDDNIQIGMPHIEGSITARVVDNGRDDKILVFHKKRRKGYQKLNGHRQSYSIIEILEFNIPGFEYKKEINEDFVEKQDNIDESIDVTSDEEISVSEIFDNTDDNELEDIIESEASKVDLDKEEK